MQNRTPSTHRRYQQAWDQILLQILRIEGPEIFQTVLKSKISAARVPRPSVTPAQVLQKLSLIATELRGGPRAVGKKAGTRAKQIAAETSAKATEKIQHARRTLEEWKKNPPDRQTLEKFALEALTLSGFLGGVLFGLQLPQIDIKLSARGKNREALILHAAALMSTEVMIEFLQECLRRTLLSPTLRDGEARFLRAVSTVLTSSLMGIERGWTARQVLGIWIRFWKSPVTKQRLIPTDARSLEIAQALIERLR